MRVTHLSLGDFRNYRVAEVAFSPGLNLIVGRNGQGKTNLAEAIAYFAGLASHRVTSDSALIRVGAEAAVARMRVSAAEREVLLEVQLNRGRPNRAQVNRNGVKPRELTRWFSCVVFAPEDLLLVRGDPGLRRRFLDESVVSRTPAFAGVLADYDRVVRQRTALLKAGRHGSRTAVDETLAIWDERLIDLGTQIMLARRNLAHALASPLRASYAAIVQHDHVPLISLLESVNSTLQKQNVSRETVAAFSPPALADGRGGDATSPFGSTTPSDNDVSRETLSIAFRRALAIVRQQEYERGMTLIGPHRDDALFELNGLPVKGYASHGESWSYALSLRLSLAELLRGESVSGDPVIILDDVFAELDARRRAALMSEVVRFEQVIVTAAVEEDVPTGVWHTVHIAAGEVLPRSPQSLVSSEGQPDA